MILRQAVTGKMRYALITFAGIIRIKCIKTIRYVVKYFAYDCFTIIAITKAMRVIRIVKRQDTTFKAI